MRATVIKDMLIALSEKSFDKIWNANCKTVCVQKMYRKRVELRRKNANGDASKFGLKVAAPVDGGLGAVGPKCMPRTAAPEMGPLANSLGVWG